MFLALKKAPRAPYIQMALPPWKLQVIVFSITPTTIMIIIPEETFLRKLKANLNKLRYFLDINE